MKNRALEIILVVIAFILLATISTWPLITDPVNQFLAGPGHNDVRFNTWVIFWGARALTTDPLQMHNANIFHPEPYTFAYSDIELSHSLLMLPVIKLTNNPELTYNLLVILCIIIGGAGMFLLARHITGKSIPSLFAALIFVFNPAHFGRYLQIQFFGDHWLPWFVWAMLLWTERKSKTKLWAALTVLFYCLHALSGSHSAVFGTLLAAALGIYRLIEKKLWTEKQFWIELVCIGIAILVILLPVFFPYFIVEKEMASQRVSSVDALRSGSANMPEFLSAGTPFYRWLDKTTGWPGAMFSSPRLRGYLFPGFVPLLLMVLSFFNLKREKTKKEFDWKAFAAGLLDLLLVSAAWTLVITAFSGARLLQLFIFSFAAPPALYVAGIALIVFALRIIFFRDKDHLFLTLFLFLKEKIAFTPFSIFWLGVFVFSIWACVGPDAGLYAFLAKMPLVKLIRVPRRFILVATFAMALLAAWGLAKLIKRLETKRFVSITVVIVLLAFFALEANYAPLHLYPVKNSPPEVYEWLGTLEGDFAVMEFPVSSKGYAEFIRQVYGSIHHWKKLLVGYSGYQSEENIELIGRLNSTFPQESCLQEMRDLDVKIVLVFETRITDAQREMLQNSPELKEIKRFGDLIAYQLLEQ